MRSGSGCGRCCHSRPAGRAAAGWDHRQVVNGIIWRTRTGAPWRDLPERYGPWETCYKWFAHWETDGTWAMIEQALQREVDAAGELDWWCRRTPARCAPTSTPPVPARGADAAGLSSAASIGPLPRRLVDQGARAGGRAWPAAGDRTTPGQAADTTELLGLVDAVRVPRPGGVGRPRVRPNHLVADKAYSSRANRAGLRARKIPHTIPERDDQRAHRQLPGHPDAGLDP
jgi:transposase